MKTKRSGPQKHPLKLGLIGGASVLIMLGSPAVFALPSQASSHAQAANQSASSNQANTNRSNNPSSEASTRLASAQLRACQNRENAINNILGRINTRAQNQLTLFGTIATRVENFYTNKGNTVSNYSQLVAAIDTAKTQAQTDLSTMQNSGTFSCSSDDPKGMVTAFQGYLKTEVADLQNYRTAVKNLIVAVAKANGETVSNSVSSSTTAQGVQQ